MRVFHKNLYFIEFTHPDSRSAAMFVDRWEHCLLERLPYQWQPKQHLTLWPEVLVPVYVLHFHSLAKVLLIPIEPIGTDSCTCAKNWKCNFGGYSWCAKKRNEPAAWLRYTPGLLTVPRVLFRVYRRTSTFIGIHWIAASQSAMWWWSVSSEAVTFAHLTRSSVVTGVHRLKWQKVSND